MGFFRSIAVEQHPIDYSWECIEGGTLFWHRSASTKATVSQGRRHFRNCFQAWTSSWIARAGGKVWELMMAHSR